MMQINVNPAGLTQKQREAVAGFILAFPAGDCAGTCHTQPASTVSAALAVHMEQEPALLAKEGGEAEAAQTFQVDNVAQIFGGTPAPLPPGATVAPSTAAAVPFSIVPAVMPDTSVAQTSAPLPNVQNAAPIPPAPAAALQTTSHAAGVDLDKAGLPWDGRIHAESKNKIADGTWRKKRNLDPALLASVEAELRQVMGAPSVPNVQSAPAPTSSVASPIVPDGAAAGSVPFVAAPNVFASSPTPAAGVAGLSNAAPPPPAAAPSVTPPALGVAATTPAAPSSAPVEADARQQFVSLVGRASAAIQGKKVTQDEIIQCCQMFGVPALPLLANRLDLVSQVAANIDAIIASRP